MYEEGIFIGILHIYNKYSKYAQQFVYLCIWWLRIKFHITLQSVALCNVLTSQENTHVSCFVHRGN